MLLSSRLPVIFALNFVGLLTVRSAVIAKCHKQRRILKAVFFILEVLSAFTFKRPETKKKKKKRFWERLTTEPDLCNIRAKDATSVRRDHLIVPEERTSMNVF